MSMPTLQFTGPSLELFARADTAIGHVPPAFPLSATVAVNPYLGQAGEARAITAARLARVAGQRLFRPRSDLAEMYNNGRLTMADLETAAQASGGLVATDLIAAMKTSSPAPKALPHVADLAEEVSGIGWKNASAPGPRRISIRARPFGPHRTRRSMRPGVPLPVVT